MTFGNTSLTLRFVFIAGVACRSNHLCGYHGNSYVWCYIDYYDNWQYCAHDPNDNLNNIIDSEVDNVREEVSSDLSQITRRLEVLESRLLETNPRETFSPDVTIIIANLAPVSAHETETALNLAPVSANETETVLNLAPVSANETENVLNLAPAGANETEATHNLAPVGANETETTLNLAPVGAKETETTLNLAPVGAKETETTLNLTPVGATETETALMDKIRQILAEGLALPHIEPVAVTRLAVRRRGPGLVLLELRDVEDKITVMNAKQSLKNKDEYKNLDLRAAEGHTDRLMRLNFNTLLSHLNRRREFWFTVSGRLVPREHGSSVEPAGRAVGGDITIVASEPADA